jgi:hypothetical protein
MTPSICSFAGDGSLLQDTNFEHSMCMLGKFDMTADVAFEKTDLDKTTRLKCSREWEK